MPPAHGARVVEGRGHERGGADARVEGAVPQCVAAAEADPDAAEPGRVHGGLRGLRAARAAQVSQLAGRVLVLARLAVAGPEAAVVEDQRGQPGVGQAAGVDRDDLFPSRR
jgi:hypothetical protein